MEDDRQASEEVVMTEARQEAERPPSPSHSRSRSRSVSSEPSIEVVESSTTQDEVQPTVSQAMSLDGDVNGSHDDSEHDADADDESEVEVVLIDSAGGTATPQNSRPPPQTPGFDPAALLNPKAASKRPAADAEPERGREDVTNGGQISLVERLHNVHERTSSPAKRPRTEDEQQKKGQLKANIGGGSALDLKKENGLPAPVPKAAAIDLTMSKCLVDRS